MRPSGDATDHQPEHASGAAIDGLRGPTAEIPYEHAEPLVQATVDVATLEVQAAMLEHEGQHAEAAQLREERDLAIRERDSLRRPGDAGRRVTGS